VFVGSLSYQTTEDEVRTTFAEAGELVSVRIPLDRETGRSRGFAFVEFATEAAAAEAIRRFDGFELGGRRLRVNAAEDRPPSRPREGFRPPSFPPEEPGFGAPRKFKAGGSRRGIRGRKRSLY
jgi:cold-inducible RNA-binding protein